ncbi:MAG TPA: polysaccharide deacetylase family protein [Puia sp.]|nr:polysaccharide deacetylase family protein [Puia sp.]
MPAPSQIYFTCSFDDGDVADLRLADLMGKHSIRGTFYIPQKCDLVNKSLSDEQINELPDFIEVGGHTITHSILTSINNDHASKEIRDCKKWLEDVTGKNIKAFCPPTGRFNEAHLRMIQNSGYKLVRTVEMMQTKKISKNKSPELTIIPTSVQAYNHTYISYLKNILKRFNISLIRDLMKIYDKDWLQMARNHIKRLLFTDNTNGTSYFHLWGHSWEIEKYNLWKDLEIFFKEINESGKMICCTNTELVTLMRK